MPFGISRINTDSGFVDGNRLTALLILNVERGDFVVSLHQRGIFENRSFILLKRFLGLPVVGIDFRKCHISVGIARVFTNFLLCNIKCILEGSNLLRNFVLTRCRLDLSETEIATREIVVQREVSAAVRQHTLIFANRFLIPAYLLIDKAEFKSCHRVIGVNCQRLLEVSDCPVILSLFGVDDATIAVYLWRLQLQFNRLCIRFQRKVKLELREVDIAQSQIRLRHPRI